MKKSLIVGGGGFIGHNLVKRLKEEDWYVTVLDLHKPFFEESLADEFIVKDARVVQNIPDLKNFDRVYQLAADMGGAGFVFTGDNDSEILIDSLAINASVARKTVLDNFKGVLFYSSSVCLYSEESAKYRAEESDAYPANPDSNYGWEKLYSERIYQAHAKNHGLDIRIARFNNTYGPHGVFEGGREKSPAAICRKVIKADPVVEIWGDGKQIREFVYIDDLLDAVEIVMNSQVKIPINIGPDNFITINSLIELARQVEDKEIEIKYIDGPIGLQSRLTGNEIIKSLGWKPKISEAEGIKRTYNWIKSQMK